MGDIGPIRRRYEAVPETDPVRPAPAEPTAPQRDPQPTTPVTEPSR